MATDLGARTPDRRHDVILHVGWPNEHRQTAMFEFRLAESDDAFRIDAASGGTATIRVDPWRVSVSTAHELPSSIHALVDTGSLVEELSAYFESLQLGSANGSWHAAEIERAIAPAVHNELHRLRHRMDPAALAVQDEMWTVVGRHAALAADSALYEEPHIVRDVLRFPAAVVALAWASCGGWPCECDVWPGIHPAPQAPAPWLDSGISVDQCSRGGGELPLADRLQRMHSWRGLFSPTGTAYRSLNRTLMDLPTASTLFRQLTSRLPYLRLVQLDRPITNALELLTLLVFIEEYHSPRSLLEGLVPEPNVLKRQTAVLKHAKESEIRSAIQRVVHPAGQQLDPGCVDDIKWLLRILCDYPDPPNARLGGWVTRAIRWHRDVRDANTAVWTLLQLDGPDTPTAQPPIPLPVIAGVRFLATVGDIVEEGTRMQHCVAAYAAAAVSGKSFLFHVEHRGEHASIQLSVQGRVVQAAGPCNQRNRAAQWGARQLAAWGCALVHHRAVGGR